MPVAGVLHLGSRQIPRRDLVRCGVAREQIRLPGGPYQVPTQIGVIREPHGTPVRRHEEWARALETLGQACHVGKP